MTTPYAEIPDTLRGQFITARHQVEIAQDWLLKHAPQMVDLSRLPWINQNIGGGDFVTVHLCFSTRFQAMRFGAMLGNAMEEGSSYFDIEYERFVVHLHYVSYI